MDCKDKLASIVKTMPVESVLNAIPSYVLIIDKSHKILFANQAVKSQLSFNPGDLIGGYCPKLIHEKDEPIDICPLEESVKTGVAISREYFDEGYSRWFSSAVYPITELEQRETTYLHMVHDITERKEFEKQLQHSNKKLNYLMNSVIQALILAVEHRDPYTAGHQLRVSKLACAIAEVMGLEEERIEGIRIAALMHDIGKIGLPIEILSKPGKINFHEFSIIKNHCNIGFDILKEIDFPWPVAKTVLQHHERINGSGYPNNLTSADILPEAKIIGVADVFEAMISHRPYRQALDKNTALAEIRENRGIIYDPEVVDACIELIVNRNYCFD